MPSVNVMVAGYNFAIRAIFDAQPLSVVWYRLSAGIMQRVVPSAKYEIRENGFLLLVKKASISEVGEYVAVGVLEGSGQLEVFRHDCSVRDPTIRMWVPAGKPLSLISPGTGTTTVTQWYRVMGGGGRQSMGPGPVLGVEPVGGGEVATYRAERGRDTLNYILTGEFELSLPNKTQVVKEYTMNVIEDQEVELVLPEPTTPTTTWYRVSQSGVRSELSGDNNGTILPTATSLVFTRVTLGDAGVYEAEVETDLQTFRHVYRVTVDRLPSPFRVLESYVNYDVVIRYGMGRYF
eukprot:sb/3467579/